MQERANVAKFKGNPVTLLGKEIKVGDKAPNFTALKPDLSNFNLSDIKNKVVIVTSYPSIDTPVCSIQAGKFNAEAEKHKEEIVIVEISADLPFAVGRYANDNCINSAIMVSDHKDLDYGNKYGFIIKELRLLERGVVVIDKNGIVKHVEYCAEITNEPNYEKAIEVAKSLI